MKLEGKVAIFTGAAGGIGQAAARRFAQEGARVVLVDRNAPRGEAVAAELSAQNLPALFVTCDVTSSTQIEQVMVQAQARFGTPDILFNNAAVYRSIDFLSMTEAQFDEVIRCNLNSVFLFSQAFARGLVSRRMPGAIVNTTSINCRLTSGMATAYTVSKGGVSSFTAALSLALVNHGIRVNAIAPGTIATDFASSVRDDPAVLAVTQTRTPMRRLGEPEEIAAVACFLASDDASYMTGQTIFVDGGRTALGIVMPPRATSSRADGGKPAGTRPANSP
jgi:NAD(P)-dependent dehydrogenase (short-subunit alcohol dehydrogenase family)